MKKKILIIMVCILFLFGFSLLLYPLAANQWNVYRQNLLISSYDQVADSLEEEEFVKEWEKAESFNDALGENDIYAETPEEGEENQAEITYQEVLNIAGNGVMGYLSIPKIDVKLAIYHGTGDDVLRTGVGHLSGTNLPTGGKGTHAVLAAHRGFPGAKLFTDLDRLEKGDEFYIHVLDEVHAYKVDRILPMVRKDDRQTLEEACRAEEGKDHVTLLTCTPYGTNSHRLLVRGERIEGRGMGGEKKTAGTVLEFVGEAANNVYILYASVGGLVTLLIIVFMCRIGSWEKKEKKVTDPNLEFKE